MNLREYFGDLRKIEAVLENNHPDGIVHVTSLFHRERNSTPGTTSSATPHNASRVITDGTHREATPGEVEQFMRHQDHELRRNTASEQKNKRQYIVVVDQQDRTEPVFPGSESAKTVIANSRVTASSTKPTATQP